MNNAGYKNRALYMMRIYTTQYTTFPPPPQQPAALTNHFLNTCTCPEIYSKLEFSVNTSSSNTDANVMISSLTIQVI